MKILITITAVLFLSSGTLGQELKLGYGGRNPEGKPHLVLCKKSKFLHKPEEKIIDAQNAFQIKSAHDSQTKKDQTGAVLVRGASSEAEKDGRENRRAYVEIASPSSR